MKYSIILFLFTVLILNLAFSPFKEGFELSPGIYPKSEEGAVLDDYPKIGKNDTSNNNYSDIWRDYPTFTVGSYEQITNNFKYNKNPDNGTCIRADFCGALYKDGKTRSNIINPLPPAEEGGGARVGYYRSQPNELYFSIPTNENILY